MWLIFRWFAGAKRVLTMSTSVVRMYDMIDGPHRSLPLSNHWKRVAERLDNGNYGSADLREAVCRAIAHDWSSDVGRPFLEKVLRTLHQTQPDMHRPLTVQLDELRLQAHGHPVRAELLELAHEVATAPWCPDGPIKTVKDVLCGLAARRRNQIVDHYRHRAPERVSRIGGRLDGLQREIEQDLEHLAGEVAMDLEWTVPVPLKTGLDDGVPL